MTPTAAPAPADSSPALPPLDPGESVAGSVAERRRSPRQRRETNAWLSSANGVRTGKGQNVRVKDLSLHGVGFVAEQPMAKHDTYWMVIADQSLRLSTRLRVIAARQRPDGKWDVGAEFF